MKERKVNDSYIKNYYTINNGKGKTVDDLICYCLKKETGYMITIKNLGVKLMELSWASNDEKEDDKIADNYMSGLKIDIPDWCPLERKR
jgi:hypothetical protein